MNLVLFRKPPLTGGLRSHVSEWQMIFPDAVDGILDELIDLYSTSSCSRCDLFAEEPRYRSGERDRIRVSVANDISPEELPEAVEKQSRDCRLAAYLIDIRHDRSKELVSFRLAVSSVKYSRARKSAFIHETPLDSSWEQSLEAVTYEASAQVSSAALITEDVSEWRYIPQDPFPIVEARV